MESNSSGSKSSSSSSSLQRGRACLNCRRRKMRCDGVRPVCGQCVHANKHDDCGYTDVSTRNRTQILEENIAILEARIQELENPESAPISGPVMLHDPRSKSHYSHLPRSPTSSVSLLSPSPWVFRQAQLSVLSPHSSGASESSSLLVGTSSPRSSLSSQKSLEKLPADVATQLTDAFFEHSSQLGWFLSVTRFRHALLLPEDNVSRPISALVNTVYLIGATNMHQITGKYPPIDENVYLQRALSAIGHALEDAPSQKVVQVIQARVLLALYHYSMGKFIEGRHHSDAAASLVLSCGLHKIRSTDTPQHASSFVDIIALMLPPPQDQVEEGERINALWTVFTICRCWGIAFGAPILISDNDAFGTQIDTPWPLDMETYERGPVFPNFRTSRTLRNFLAGMNTSWPWENHSLLAQISNASALFDRATHLSSYRRPDIPDMDAFYTNFMAVDSRIDQFRSQLYALPNLVDADSDVVRTMHVIHCLANTASIQLHSAFAQHNIASRNKCFMAAQAIVQANFSVRAHEFLIIDPVLGIVWGAACQVFIRELVFMRSIPANATPLPPDHETEVWLALNQLQTTMAIFAPVCAFIGSQLDKVQQELMGL